MRGIKNVEINETYNKNNRFFCYCSFMHGIKNVEINETYETLLQSKEKFRKHK